MLYNNLRRISGRNNARRCTRTCGHISKIILYKKLGRNAIVTPCLLGGLEMLINSGSNAEAQLALVGKEFRPSRDYKKVGRSDRQPFATWGDKIQRIDYNAWELSFGNLRCVSIDMGDSIPLHANLRQARSTPEIHENSQCVLLHLALGAE